ncbi:MAG: Kelch repeat type 1-containing protein [Daejeonella sp.]|nr:Kelch repeat type 1-containing protein [Daejeonella sp.]
MKKIAFGLVILCLGLTSCKESALETPQLASKGTNKINTTTAWTYVGDIPENIFNWEFSFAFGNKAYLGQGDTNYDEYFMYEYDSENNIWTAGIEDWDYDANVTLGTDAVGFAIGEFGYAGTGTIHRAGAGFSAVNDLWQYNPKTNAWIRKRSTPIPLTNTVGFSIGNKGYVGTGYTGYEGTPDGPFYFNFVLTNDFYEYDPQTDIWTKKASFPGKHRLYAKGFSIGNKGYIGMGMTPPGIGYCFFQDLWAYNQETNKWKRQADFPGGALTGVIAFSIGNKGYMGGGFGKLDPVTQMRERHYDMWEFDPENNSWKLVQPLPEGRIAVGDPFIINDKAYITTLFDNKRELWIFDPSK